jgi:hypothetical protein
MFDVVPPLSMGGYVAILIVIFGVGIYALKKAGKGESKIGYALVWLSVIYGGTLLFFLIPFWARK